MIDAQLSILAECDPLTSTVSSETYRKASRSLAEKDRPALLQWVVDTGIEILPCFSMTALYHHEPGRKYRPTRQELETKKFQCPLCKILLVRVTRKALDPLFQCRDCGWSIARSDIFEPAPEEEPDLRTDVAYGEGIVPSPEDLW